MQRYLLWPPGRTGPRSRGGWEGRVARHSYARLVTHQHHTNFKMAIAQVSTVSAIKVAPAARATKARSARAVKVSAKATVGPVEVAKKVAPVALSVGACPPLVISSIALTIRPMSSSARREAIGAERDPRARPRRGS